MFGSTFTFLICDDQEGPPDDEDEEDLALEANEDGASTKRMMCTLYALVI